MIKENKTDFEKLEKGEYVKGITIIINERL